MRPNARIAPLVLASALIAPGSTLAATAQDFLDAPVWYVHYEVTFVSNYTVPTSSMHGPMTSTTTFTRVLTGTDKLNLRSQGPGAIGMAELTEGMGKSPSMAESQKMTMKMMSMMDVRANWMVGGDAVDGGSSENSGLVTAGTVSVDYTCVATGKDLVNETGSKYDLTVTSTVKGSGPVQSGGMGVSVLELDTSDNSFAVTLPFACGAQGPGAKMQIVSVAQGKGGSPDESRSERDVRFDTFPADITLDSAPKGSAQGGVLLRGTFDPATGKIAGEQSFPAHWNDNTVTPAPATLTFRYTLTTTPPAKK